VMFNNAGVVGAIGPVADTEAAAWARTIDILLTSVFYGCKHAARVMVPQGSGSIISTSSAAGLLGGLGPHAYTASKAAVIALTKSVAAELGQQGVRCNAIAPGAVPTALTAHALSGDVNDLDAVAESSRQRYGRAGDAMDIANAALYLASDEAGYVSGHTLVVDYGRTTNGGSTRFAGSGAGMVGIPGRD
jgi:NAD(P)-dependent dehydrogenase (short-subunit alcohol dehydrogenase family)